MQMSTRNLIRTWIINVKSKHVWIDACQTFLHQILIHQTIKNSCTHSLEIKTREVYCSHSEDIKFYPEGPPFEEGTCKEPTMVFGCRVLYSVRLVLRRVHCNVT